MRQAGWVLPAAAFAAAVLVTGGLFDLWVRPDPAGRGPRLLGAAAAGVLFAALGAFLAPARAPAGPRNAGRSARERGAQS